MLSRPYRRRPRGVAGHGAGHGVCPVLRYLRRRSTHHRLAPSRWRWTAEDVGEGSIALRGRGGRTRIRLTAVVAALLGVILCHVACPELVAGQFARHPGLPTGRYPADFAPLGVGGSWSRDPGEHGRAVEIRGGAEGGERRAAAERCGAPACGMRRGRWWWTIWKSPQGMGGMGGVRQRAQQQPISGCETALQRASDMRRFGWRQASSCQALRRYVRCAE